MVLLLLAQACGGSNPAPQSAPLFIVPATATVKVGGQIQFRAQDAQGNPVEARLNLISGPGGSVDAAGRFRAPATPGSFRIQAVAVADPRRTAEATIQAEPYANALETQANLLVPRSAHTATRLADGSVLVVGGLASSQAERYSPENRTFTLAASLGAPRWYHSASFLPNGAVLVAGGERSPQTLDSALLYEGESFTAIPAPMASPRRRHGASVLADGRVLLSGGLPVSGSEVNATESAETFDPTSRRFRATGTLAVPRADHTATTLKDGRVLIVGGRNSTCFISCPIRVWATAEIYDPANGAFSPTGSLHLARFSHTATLLPDGRVLVAGGTTTDLPFTDLIESVEIYDPATGTFSEAGRMLRPRSQHQATLLGDGTVLLSGGRSESDGTLASPTVESFNPATGTSKLTFSDRTTRYLHAAVLLENGEVLLLGGSEGGGPIAISERFR
jgi:hypothetical protein